MKTYIKINLNKAESSEVIKERRLEQTRWVVFGVLVFSLFVINLRVWMMGFGYNSVIEKKKNQIQELKEEIRQLQSKGKNLSKNDITLKGLIAKDSYVNDSKGATLNFLYISNNNGEKLKSEEQTVIKDLNLDRQLLEKINKFAPIKYILKNKTDDENEIIELLEDISRDLINYDLEFRIQELESKFSRDMNEATFNELKELKKKQNIN